MFCCWVNVTSLADKVRVLSEVASTSEASLFFELARRNSLCYLIARHLFSSFHVYFSIFIQTPKNFFTIQWFSFTQNFLHTLSSSMSPWLYRLRLHLSILSFDCPFFPCVSHSWILCGDLFPGILFTCANHCRFLKF